MNQVFTMGSDSFTRQNQGRIEKERNAPNFAYMNQRSLNESSIVNDLNEINRVRGYTNPDPIND